MQLPMSTNGPKVKRAQLDHMSLPQWDIVTSNYKAQVRAVCPCWCQLVLLTTWHPCMHLGHLCGCHAGYVGGWHGDRAARLSSGPLWLLVAMP